MVRMDEIKTGAAISDDASVDEPLRHSPPRRRRTRWARLAVIGAVIAIAVWLAAPWVIARFTTVHINDARIAARIVTVSSEVAGRVTAIPVLLPRRLWSGCTANVLLATSSVLGDVIVENS